MSLRVSIDGYTREPIDLPLTTLVPGARVREKLALSLDRQKLLAHEELRNAVLTVKTSYFEGEYRVEEEFKRPVIIYPRTALNWGEDERSIASFVDPAAPALASMVSKVREALPKGVREERLGLPVALFDALDGVAYAPDPIHPYKAEELDFVQYPLQTLTRKQGDCDDLAVAYASFLEAAGYHTMLVLTPGHVMVAIETAIPTHAPYRIVPEGLGFIPYKGTVWIPIETTAVGKSFRDAWQRATSELRRASKRGEPKLIVLEEAWNEYPGVNLTAVSEVLPPKIDRTKVSSQLAEVSPSSRATRFALSTLKTKRRTPANLDRAGTLYAKLGESEKAREAFEAALQKNPGHLPAVVHLANLDLEAARYGDALEKYERVLKKKPQDPTACLSALMASLGLEENKKIAEYHARCRSLPGYEDLVNYIGRSRTIPGTRAGQQARASYVPYWP